MIYFPEEYKFNPTFPVASGLSQSSFGFAITTYVTNYNDASETVTGTGAWDNTLHQKGNAFVMTKLNEFGSYTFETDDNGVFYDYLLTITGITNPDDGFERLADKSLDFTYRDPTPGNQEDQLLWS